MHDIPKLFREAKPCTEDQWFDFNYMTCETGFTEAETLKAITVALQLKGRHCRTLNRIHKWLHTLDYFDRRAERW